MSQSVHGCCRRRRRIELSWSVSGVVAVVMVLSMVATRAGTTTQEGKQEEGHPTSTIDDEEQRPQADKLKWWRQEQPRRRREGDGSSTDQEEEQRRRILPPPPLPPCMDLNPACPSWMEQGECTKNVLYMTTNCPWSCNLCNPLWTFNSDEAIVLDSSQEEQRDDDDDDDDSKDENAAALEELVLAVQQTRHRPLLEWAGMPQRTNFTKSIGAKRAQEGAPRKEQDTAADKKKSQTAAGDNNKKNNNNATSNNSVPRRRTITTTTNAALGENEQPEPAASEEEEAADDAEASWNDHLANEGGTGMVPPPHKQTPSYIRGRLRHVTLAMESYLQSLDEQTFQASKSTAPPMVLHRINDESFSFVTGNDRGGVAFYPHFRQSFASNIDDLPDVVATSVHCKNRHENCGYWAARGLCEWKLHYMKEVCAPMCHLCHSLDHRKKYKPGVASNSGIRAHSPFQRLDLVGLFEAMEEDRVVVETSALKAFSSSSYSESSSEEDAGSNSLSVLPLGQLKTYVYRLRAGSASAQMASRARGRWEERKRRAAEKSMRRRQGEAESGKSHNKKPSQTKTKKEAENKDTGRDLGEDVEDAADGPFIVQFDKFLTMEECSVILDLLREQTERKRMEENRYYDDEDDDDDDEYRNDGFTSTTMDVTVEEEGQVLNIVRSSFREYYYPPHKEGQSHWWEHHAVLSRLLSKLEVVTGVPRQHIELPLQFDKYYKDDFQDVSSHFAHATAPKPDGGRKTKSSQASGSWTGKDSKEDAYSRLDEPRLMQNAPIIGVILFLSTLEQGGELVFPNMGNFTVKPFAGRAILFPTTLSLVGEGGWFRSNGDGQLHWGYFANSQDTHDSKKTTSNKKQQEGWEDVHVLDGTKVMGDETFLVEDLGTLFRHNVVKQRPFQKPKYTVTIYMRRYPREE